MATVAWLDRRAHRIGPKSVIWWSKPEATWFPPPWPNWKLVMNHVIPRIHFDAKKKIIFRQHNRCGGGGGGIKLVPPSLFLLAHSHYFFFWIDSPSFPVEKERTCSFKKAESCFSRDWRVTERSSLHTYAYLLKIQTGETFDKHYWTQNVSLSICFLAFFFKFLFWYIYYDWRSQYPCFSLYTHIVGINSPPAAAGKKRLWNFTQLPTYISHPREKIDTKGIFSTMQSRRGN